MTASPHRDVRAYQRFHDHFMIAKMFGGDYRGYNPGVSQGFEYTAGRIAHNATTDKGPNDRGPTKAKQVRPGDEVEVIHDPFHLPWSHHAHKAYDLSLS